MAYVMIGGDWDRWQSSTSRKDYSFYKRGVEEEKNWPNFCSGASYQVYSLYQ